MDRPVTIEYVVALLEEIAFHTSTRSLEKEIYLQGVYDASRQQSATPLHGDVRTQPATRQRPVPGDVEKRDAQVRVNPGKGLASPKIEKKPA